MSVFSAFIASIIPSIPSIPSIHPSMRTVLRIDSVKDHMCLNTIATSCREVVVEMIQRLIN